MDPASLDASVDVLADASVEAARSRVSVCVCVCAGVPLPQVAAERDSMWVDGSGGGGEEVQPLSRCCATGALGCGG